MTIHLAWLRAATAAAIAVGVGAGAAEAQFMPFRKTAETNPAAAYPSTPYPGAVPTPTPATTQGYTQIPHAVYPTAQSGYPTAQSGYPVAQPAYAPYRPQSPARIAAQPYPTTSAHIANRYSYPAVAQQSDGPTPSNEDTLPPPVDEVVPLNNGMPTNGGQEMPNGTQDAPANGAVQKMPAEQYNGYPNGYPNGYQNGGHSDSHGYPTTNGYGNGYAANGCEGGDYGIGRYFDDEPSGTQWFGGVYFLYMERDDPSYRKFTSAIDTTTATYPYYPQARTTVLSSDDIDYEFQPGIEVRFGSTFSVGGGYDDSAYYGASGCGHSNYGYSNDCGGCAPAALYAWEFVWWGLDEDDQQAAVENNFPAGPMRLYGLSSHAGLMYENGSGDPARPVNEYYDYQMPIEDDMPPMTDDVRVIQQRVRTYFSAQNLEINLLRLPLYDIGCGTGCGSASYGYDACGGCAPACEPECGSSFSVSGVCGVRYFRTDDDFEWSTQWARYDGAAWAPSVDELFHDIEVDNNLVGFQLGGIMNYCVASRWNFFLDTKFGFYNNHISHMQRVYSDLGNYAYYQETGEGVYVESSKDDVAFLGEMRLGGSCDISCHWRAVLAYRAVALTGVALSQDQLKSEYSNYADTARIDSDGSMVIHGVQIGAECKY